MIKEITTGFVASTLVATSVFAQSGNMPPPGERRGEFGQKVREVRQEMREDLREDRQEIREDFREDMKERKEWKIQNASGTATGTMPTPWKNLRENVKEARGEFRDEMKDVREDMRDKFKDMRDDRREMRPRMATLTDAQATTIAGKLGITAEALKAQLASGTKLKELVKDKINPEDMKLILPPKVASMTRPIEERGFFNQFRSRIFGQRQEEIQQIQNEFGEIEEVSRPIVGTGFFRKLFNW